MTFVDGTGGLTKAAEIVRDRNTLYAALKNLERSQAQLHGSDARDVIARTMTEIQSFLDGRV